MVLSCEDKVLIKNLHLSKGYGARKLMSEFPDKNWKRSSLDKLLKKIQQTGMVQRKKGSGRPKTARTAQNVSAVEELALSQESQPNTHRSVREIVRETGIWRSSVFRVIHNDLRLKCLKKLQAQELTESNRANRLQRARMLLKMNPDDQVNFM